MGLAEVNLRNRKHKAHRSGWLRAAVLGVNDGLVSTASLMVGVAAASASLGNAKEIIISTGIAGVAAGALSMAVGEYISVSSQTDIESADRQLEIEHLAIDPDGELEELVEIYKSRGLDEPLARQVATQLSERDALNAHLRDELGQHPHSKAKPIQASLASALSFALGGLVPFMAVFAPSVGSISFSIVTLTIIGLAIAGGVGAKISGSKLLVPTLRVLIGGCLGMGITAAIGQLFHVAVA